MFQLSTSPPAPGGHPLPSLGLYAVRKLMSDLGVDAILRGSVTMNQGKVTIDLVARDQFGKELFKNCPIAPYPVGQGSRSLEGAETPGLDSFDCRAVKIGAEFLNHANLVSFSINRHKN
jgi:hypothetical protein